MPAIIGEYVYRRLTEAGAGRLRVQGGSGIWAREVERWGADWFVYKQAEALDSKRLAAPTAALSVGVVEGKAAADERGAPVQLHAEEVEQGLGVAHLSGACKGGGKGHTLGYREKGGTERGDWGTRICKGVAQQHAASHKGISAKRPPIHPAHPPTLTNPPA